MLVTQVVATVRSHMLDFDASEYGSAALRSRLFFWASSSKAMACQPAPLSGRRVLPENRLALASTDGKPGALHTVWDCNAS